MNKILEKNLTIVLLGIIGYFLFSISGSLKESAKYDSDLRACEKMKAFINDKESSKLFEQKTSLTTEVKVKFVGEYCKKLTQQNIFNILSKLFIFEHFSYMVVLFVFNLLIFIASLIKSISLDFRLRIVKGIMSS